MQYPLPPYASRSLCVSPLFFMGRSHHLHLRRAPMHPWHSAISVWWYHAPQSGHRSMPFSRSRGGSSKWGRACSATTSASILIFQIRFSQINRTSLPLLRDPTTETTKPPPGESVGVRRVVTYSL